MGNIQVTQDTAPFIVSAGVTIDVSGNATVTGAATLNTKIFDMRQYSSFSFYAQGAGTGVAAVGAAPATAWRIVACNDYDSTRPVQRPGTFIDVTALLGAAGVVTPPMVRQFNAAAFSGNTGDACSSWVCPWAFIQFRVAQQSGTEVVTGQFFAGEV